MDVYRSSKTAAEMEYALGAVPSIGENGNWFIGEQDTGIFAGGVDVTGAEVGQIIKVAEVDENGRPTAWVSDDFKLSETWEKLVDFTTEADCGMVSFTEDLNGNAFSLKKAILYVYASPVVDGDSTSGAAISVSFNSAHAVALGPHNHGVISLPNVKNTETASWRTAMFEKAGDMIYVTNWTMTYNNTSMPVTQGYNSALFGGFKLHGLDKTCSNCTDLSVMDALVCGSYAKAIGAGTRFILYGVRE